MNENELEIVPNEVVTDVEVELNEQTKSMLKGGAIGLVVGGAAVVGAYFLYKKIKSVKAKKAAEAVEEPKKDEE